MGNGPSFDNKTNFYYMRKPEIKPIWVNEDDQKLEDVESKAAYEPPVIDISERLSEQEIQFVKKNYDKLSINEVIGKNKLLEYFNLLDFKDTPLASGMLYLLKNTNDSQNGLVTWDKFISFVTILSKGTKEERLQLIFKLFDSTSNAEVTKKSVKDAITSLLFSLLKNSYDEKSVENMRQSYFKGTEQQHQAAIDLYVDEIFAAFSSKDKPDALTYSQWCSWICSLTGMETILAYEHKLPLSQHNI
jgi:Ca2+-binding EF-hand superfamily protein